MKDAIQADEAGSQDMSSLNENQLRCIKSTCEFIDRQMTEIENILNSPASGAAFQRYLPDIPAVKRQMIEDSIAVFRRHIVHVLDSQGIEINNESVPASRAVQSSLASIDIASEELRPKHMRGYGGISADMAAGLESIAGELHALVRVLGRYTGEDDDR